MTYKRRNIIELKPHPESLVEDLSHDERFKLFSKALEDGREYKFETDESIFNENLEAVHVPNYFIKAIDSGADLNHYISSDIIKLISRDDVNIIQNEIPRPNNVTFNFKVDLSDYEDQEDLLKNLINFLRLVGKHEIADFEIYEDNYQYPDSFVFENSCCGFTLDSNDDADKENTFLIEDKSIVEAVHKETMREYGTCKRIYRKEEDISYIHSIIDNIDKDSDIKPIIYFPYVYLYMCDLALMEELYEDGYLDNFEYDKWKCFNSLMNHENLKDARFIITKKCWEDSYHKGWFKMNSGIVNVNSYGKDSKDILDNMFESLDRDRFYIFDDENISNFNKVPNSIIYSDSINSVILRTNISRRHNLDRVLNVVEDKRLAELIYLYLTNVYEGMDYTVIC